jgi:Cu-processing system permease protein
MNAILAVAQTEILIGIRNRWVVLSTVILLVFALILVLLGSATVGNVKTNSLTVIVASLTTLSVYLVPLIALLLSFDAIAGEIDRGTLQLAFATSASRGQILIGKFLGHVTVLTIAIVLGYGISGVIAGVAGDGLEMAGLIDLSRLIGTSIALGATFLAIGYVVSSVARHPGTAAALAIAVWLFAVVLFDMALLGGLLVSSDGIFAKSVFPYLLVLNPADAFRVYNMSALDAGNLSAGIAASGKLLPFPAHLTMLSLVLWAVLGLASSIFILRKLQP